MQGGIECFSGNYMCTQCVWLEFTAIFFVDIPEEETEIFSRYVSRPVGRVCVRGAHVPPPRVKKVHLTEL